MAGIENGAQAGFQRTESLGHGDGGAGCGQIDPREGKEQFGVNGGFDAAGEDEVVAGMLGGGAHAGGGEPSQRVEPIKGAGEAGEELCEGVAAADVGEFVEEDTAEVIGGPIVGGLRQKDHWAEDAPGHGHGGGCGLQEADGASEMQLDGEVEKLGEDFWGGDGDSIFAKARQRARGGERSPGSRVMRRPARYVAASSAMTFSIFDF